VSPHTQELIDEEVRRLVERAHDQVLTLLRENRAKLDSLADALLERETLDEDDAYAAAGVPKRQHAPAEYAAAARTAAT
jgi:cell division protease FtsH